jgi:uncharacterized membrane protein
MSATHIHLLINHLPVMGTFLGIIVLLIALRSASKSTFLAAYVLLLVAAVGAIIAFATGEPAEEMVEGISGISKASIEPHEEAAAYAFGSFTILGLLSLAGLIILSTKESLQRTWGLLIVIVSFVSFTLVARTAWLGGKIRHTETSATVQNNGIEDGDDD